METGAPMFEEFLPKRKLGVLTPLAVTENGPFEFYRMAPPGVMMVMVPCGLKEFSREDVERVFAPLDALVDSLVQRQVDIITSSGVPLSLLMGIEAHDAFLSRIEARSGKPASSTLTAAIAAARHLGVRKISFVNKWDDDMNAALAAFFARDGIETAGTVTEVLPLDRFQGMASTDSMDLAYALGRRALEQFPEADGLFISGGTWLAQPVCERLEREFGKPCLGNQACALWDALHKVDYWTPIKDRGMLLANG
jgi:maleate cis-trans isomerase